MNYKNLLVTGGAGFIGSNFIRYIFNKKKYSGNIINVDKLTYAGNAESLLDIDNRFGGKNYFFEYGDICDRKRVLSLFEKYNIDAVCHFAAESHVDRSIVGPEAFIDTNIKGTFVLLETAREFWKDAGQDKVRFHHISTDEVYGSLGAEGYFYEDTPYNPRSPYSASKASSDHLVRAYYHTYNLPVTISNCSNNYGPWQFPEKLIPVIILNCIEGKKLPVYGEGKNIRDWLFVEDHCEAIYKIMTKGKVGETYNIGGGYELQNIVLVRRICAILDEFRPRTNGKKYEELITFVKDRPGHDMRYAINCDKIMRELNWKQKVSFDEGIKITIDWYLNNTDWINSIRSGEYMQWIEKNYLQRN